MFVSPSVPVRLGVAAIAALVASIALEGALRLAYSALPSVAGLEQTDYRLETLVDAAEGGDEEVCRDARTFLSHRSRWGPEVRGPHPGAPLPGPPKPGPPKPGPSGRGAPPKPGEPLTATEVQAGGGIARRSLWLVGDSVTYGLGVAAADTFGAGLARRLAEHFGEAVVARNLGVPGGGFCASVRRLATEQAAHRPDLVLIVFFADDLEEHSLLTVQGHLIAPPDVARSAPVRWLITRSYLANLAWYRAVGASLFGPRTDGRFVSPDAVADFEAAARVMRDRVQEAGGIAIFTLLPTPSEANCTTPDPASRCRWLANDVERMGTGLRAAGIPFLDLRGVWPLGAAHVVADEQTVVAEGGVAMHPNEVGHGLLANAIWTALAQEPELLAATAR